MTITTIEDLQASLDDSPFQRLFALKAIAADKDAQRLVIRQEFTPSVERQAGTRQYHGGAIASLIDIAGDYALAYLLGFGVPTINFRVDYLRPAIDTALLATASVRRAGRSIGVVDIDVTDDKGRLIAVGRGCYGTTAG
jgi:uncharacterized protein (TIGR00369 family)